MQGFNMGRYHAPSTLDPSLSSSVPAKRSLGSTSSKAPPTIRFEMPFAIWCSTCPQSSTSCLIGQGVRFNALKSKVGNYFSTPVWQFRMKHTACGGWIEIRTDPKSSEYIVTDGARKRDTGDDAAVAERIGGVLVGDDAEKEKRRQDAFAALEGKKEDKERVKGEAKRLEELKSLKERDWKNVDYSNKRLREAFRIGRKERERDAEGVERLKSTMGLGLEFVKEEEADVQKAKFVDFGGARTIMDEVARKSMFDPSTKGPSKGVAMAHGPAKALRQQVTENTRASLDPFSLPQNEEPSATLTRRKRGQTPTSKATAKQKSATSSTNEAALKLAGPQDLQQTPRLVEYDSDSSTTAQIP